MTEEELQEIEARAEAASEGPWEVVGTTVDGATDHPDDIEFIARARQDVPALVTEVRRLREQRARALKLVRELEMDIATDNACGHELTRVQEIWNALEE